MCKINRNFDQESAANIKLLSIQKPKEKEKRRNNEKRKEKSRDAARCRRSRETEIFNDLANALPLKQEEIDHLDKASVMRLSISYLNVRNMLDLFPKIKNLDIPPITTEQDTLKKEVEEEDSKDFKMKLIAKFIEDEKLALQAMDGFLLVLSNDGDVTFVSENINDILGLSKIDMMGNSIWEYTHQCDHDELREVLNGRKTSPSEILNGSKSTDCNPLLHRDMMVRLKCTLTSRGRSVNIKSASYKVIHLTGHIVFKDDGYRQLLAIGRPLAHPSNIEVPLGSSTFLTKHSLDMKFSYVDSPKMFELMGYKPEHLLGNSLYDYHHGVDSENLMASFKCLISKGQTETNRYRFLARNGGFVWVVTQATVVYDKQKPQSVVCINYVISGIENEHEILSCAQFEAQQELSKTVAGQSPSSPDSGVSGTSGAANIRKGSPGAELKVKKDNIVLGISDLKQKKVNNTASANIAESTSSVAISVTCGNNKNFTSKPIIAEADNKKETSGVSNKNTIHPINTIKVNNCEIVNKRPRSVTAAIFAHPTYLTPKAEPQPLRKHPSTATTATKHRAAHTAKAFRPQSVTNTIFAPRTEDMNKGFLMFSEEEPGLTMLKDEPDDLTHLAPTAGDACIPLDDSTPFFSDMFDDFIMPDNYNALLTDELNSLDSQCSKTTSSSSSNDPFINYRDESSDLSNSPHLPSPGLSKSPDAHSIPSLCSPTSLPEDELAFMTLSMDDDIDMSMRAPYISMSESAELPLLVAEDLMWGAQPDLKQAALQMNKKPEISTNHQTNEQACGNFTKVNHTYQSMQFGKSSLESSLASLLCSQILQQRQHQLQQQQEQQFHNNEQHQIILNDNPEVKIKVLDQGNVTLVNPNSLLIQNQDIKNNAVAPVEWTMNDLLQLKKSKSDEGKATHGDTQATSINTIKHTELPALIDASAKSKEKSSNNHKRPSLTCEGSSKRVKGLDSTSKSAPATPQLLQQLMTSAPNCQKNRSKQEASTNSQTTRWSSSSTPHLHQKSQHQQASNSVLMNLLISGCDEPLSIDTPPEDVVVGSQDSMTSPIVINDKMLTDATFNQQHLHQRRRRNTEIVTPTLFTSADLEIFRAIQQGVSDRRINADPYTHLIDSDAITKLLMELNEQEYNDIPVNELLKMM